MRFIKYLIVLMFLTHSGVSQSITSVSYKGKTYYVDLVKNMQGSSTGFQIWFRTADNASSVDDIKMVDLSAKTEDISNYVNAVCRTKDVFDAGKTIAGCTSIIGSAFCAVATDATAGTLAFACTTVWDYTLDKGAADCFKGIADIVAKTLGKQNEWMALGLIANLSEPDLEETISKALDYMCEDVKSNAQDNTLP